MANFLRKKNINTAVAASIKLKYAMSVPEFSCENPSYAKNIAATK
ncbi:hypothetical protein [Flavobacterium psychrophilum]|nr:hypothetical protein [Flavobacterium psychrophilum]